MFQMQHIPPLVFSALSLVDPAVTAVLSWAFGIEQWPSLFAWIGGAVVMSGVGLISYGEHQRSSKENHDEMNGTEASTDLEEDEIELTVLPRDDLGVSEHGDDDRDV